jgi:hypothetical protein
MAFYVCCQTGIKTTFPHTDFRLFSIEPVKPNAFKANMNAAAGWHTLLKPAFWR